MFDISIILVSPQMGENIGSVARAMHNFRISDLRIVAPRDGWPNSKAVETSVAASHIIDKAKIYNSLADAIFDREYIYASTVRVRYIKKEFIYSHNLYTELIENKMINNKLAIIFGRESSGLTNEEISLANKIITIQTNNEFSSMNIAHSAAIICYEISKILESKIPENSIDILKKKDEPLATSDELVYFYNHLFNSLSDKNFFSCVEKIDLVKHRVRNIFSRIDHLSKSEVRLLIAIAKIFGDQKQKS